MNSGFNEVSALVSTLQTIEQALVNKSGLDSISEQDIAALQAGIVNLQLLAESETIEFRQIKGGFISRSEAKPMAKEFVDWAADIFRSGPIKKFDPLYVSVSLVQQLLERTKPEDFVEISLGKADKKLCMLMAVVDKEGKRLDDPNKETGGDVLDHMGPCPEPPCPQRLHE